MRLCDDCIYKNNCNEYQNKVIKTTPIDFDFFGCSGYKSEEDNVLLDDLLDDEEETK